MTATIGIPVAQEWADPKQYKMQWAQRARVAARMCRSERWVCDLGCGLRFLKAFLPRGSIYLPADVVQWTGDTELCNLDAGELPLRALEVCDICVMLGVVGHLGNPLFALQSLAPYVEKVLISFTSTDFTRRRQAPRRAKAFPLSEMYSILDNANFTVSDQVQYVQHTLIKANSTLFDAAASQRRREGRAAFRPPRRPMADEWRRLMLNLRTLRTAVHGV